MTQRWYVVRTQPQCDFIAARALERDSFEHLFPCVHLPRQRGGMGRAPLFPGYLFLRCDLEESEWGLVRRLPGILGLVSFGGVVPAVPDEAVASLAERVEETNNSGGLWITFRPGDTVRVMSAKMGTLAQVLEEPKSADSRVRVLMEFMGGLVPAAVPWRDLQPVRGPEHMVGRDRPARRTRGGGRWIRGFGPQAALSG